MIGRAELRRAFGNKPFVTKGDVKELMGYSQYNEIRRFFYGLDHIGSRYLTEDVIDRILNEIQYQEEAQ